MTSITDTAFIHMATSTDADTDADRRQAVWHVIGAVQKLAHTFLEITDGILRPEAVTVGCGRRPQHH